MIFQEHVRIRTADPDDAPALHALYAPDVLCAALLDARREPLMPACAELREMLGMKEAANNVFFAVEDLEGAVRGFCILRGMNHETGFGEVSVLLHDPGALVTPLADEVIAFACERGFGRLRLNKLVATCLDGETALRAFLLRQGFESAGVQREVVFAQGRWHHLETLSLFRDRWAARRVLGRPGTAETA